MSKTILEDDIGRTLMQMQDKIASLEAILRTTSYQTGDIRASATNAQLEGWLLCDGSARKRADFPGLAQVLAAAGWPYGPGDGSTTFNVPDLRGRSPIGSGQGPGPSMTNRLLGANGGEEGHVLAVPEMPAHTHTEEGVQTLPGNVGASGTFAGYRTEVQKVTGSTGGGLSHNNMQPFLVLAFFIKT